MRNINTKRNMMYRDVDPILSIDGSTIFPDGTVILPDGSTVFPDGSVMIPEDPQIPEEVPIIDCSIINSQFTIMAPENNNLNMNRILFGTGNTKTRNNFKKSFKQNMQLKRDMQNYTDYYSNNNSFKNNYLPLQR